MVYTNTITYMARTIHLHLAEHLAERIELIAKMKGLPTSTAIREIVCEHLNALTEPPAKTPASDASTQFAKEVVPA